MNRKRKAALAIITIIIGIVVGAFALYRFTLIKDDKYVKLAETDNITRYEWIEMLCVQQGITEYQKKIPYFSDVSEREIYFPYIQSAVEWGLLNADSAFEGDGYASGRFIALTALKTIGERKLQIYLETEDVITEDIYIELAVEYGLIEEAQLTESFSKEECESVLETLKNISFNVFWKDDYSKVLYQEGVIELASKEVLQSNTDCTEITVTQNAADSLESGAVIVFEQPYTGFKATGKIRVINSDRTITLDPVELDEVVESLVISDIAEITFEDIVNYYGLKADDSTVSNLMYQQADDRIIGTKVFPIDGDSRGFKLSLSIEDKSLILQITKHDTGESYKIPLSEKVKADSGYNVEINIDKIFIGGQIDYSGLKVNYADIAIDAHAEWKGAIKADEEKKIPLLKMPISLGNGFASVDVQIYLVLSLEGEISFKAELPMEASTYYEDGTGFRNFNHKISFEDPSFEVNCDTALSFRPELTLVLLKVFKMLDTEIDVGVSAAASTVKQLNSMICSDITVAFPVMTFSVCEDDDSDTLLGSLGWSMEQEIYSSDNAPVQFGLHYEYWETGESGFVEQCTFKEEEAANDVGAVHTYTTRYGDIIGTDYPVFQFDYPDNWTVTREELRESDEEATYMNYFGEIVEIENNRGVIISYTQYEMDPALIGSGSAFGYTIKYDITKVMTSGLEAFNSSETEETDDFMIAEIREFEEMDAEGNYSDRGTSSYAVLPHSKEGSGTTDLVGFQEVCSFYYPTPYSFTATAPDGYFTEKEEKEIIAILSSFRILERERI